MQWHVRKCPSKLDSSWKGKLEKQLDRREARIAPATGNARSPTMSAVVSNDDLERRRLQQTATWSTGKDASSTLKMNEHANSEER